MIKALPCPWCDCPKYLVHSIRGTDHFISCSYCGCCGPSAENYEDAVDKWNDRLFVPFDPLQEVYEWLDRSMKIDLDEKGPGGGEE